MVSEPLRPPAELEWLFWDCDLTALDPARHGSYIIRRVLESGDWNAITWLRNSIGDTAIREWLLSNNGGKLDPRKLRFWGLILHLPAERVDEWVEKAKTSHWHKRAAV